jgi:antitoxin ParD1/3/4
MAVAEKLSIALTPELTADIREVVATGEYASTSEVIRDALRTWKEVRLGRAAAVDGLRRLWDAGVDSGEDAVLDAEDIKARGRERLAALGRSKT